MAFIGERVAVLRERRGWSKNELARRSAVDMSTVSRVESGKIVSPGVEVLRKLAEALGVDISEISGERPLPKRRAEVFEGVARVPVMRVRVQASGQPAWDDTTETVMVDRAVVDGRPNARAAVVSGTCMGAWVLAGERVVFDPDATAQDGDLVIVTDEDGGTLVKWFRVDRLGRAYLRADDGTTLRPTRAHIEGVVLYVVRRAPRDPELSHGRRAAEQPGVYDTR